MSENANKIYRHYVSKDGLFLSETYNVTRRLLVPHSYVIMREDGIGGELECPSYWLERPRGAELWTTQPDPEKAYNILLNSARKDAETAGRRLDVYQNLLNKIQRCMRQPCGAIGTVPPTALTYGRILIMGRAQSGKALFAEKLSEITGLKVLKASTTRPKRRPEENTYHFYTPEQAAAIPMSEKLFYSDKIDGCGRWADPESFLNAGIAILGPDALKEAVKIWRASGTRVTALYLETPEETRRARWMKSVAADDGSDWEQTIQAFEARKASEGPMFDALEGQINGMAGRHTADVRLLPGTAPLNGLPAAIARLCLFNGIQPAGPLKATFTSGSASCTLWTED